MSQNSAEKITTDLLEMRKKYIPGCMKTSETITLDADNGYLKTSEGRTLLDFGSGIAVTSLGHSQQEIIDAIKDQAEKFLHSCFHVTMNAQYILLAEKIAKLLPGNSAKKVMFLNSGAEATENMIKYARAYTGRKAFLAAEHGFHGRTFGALAMTSKVTPLKAGLGPFMPEVYRMPYPYSYNCTHGEGCEDCGAKCIEKIKQIFKTTISPKDIAGIIIEPVVGEGGIIVPPLSFVKGLREICDEHGILLIFDEIQTGFGRTGKMFAQEHFDVEPDITLLAKSIANGMPLSAVVGKAEIMDSPAVGAVGSTYGGNPVCCAAGLAVIEVINRNNLCENSAAMGKLIIERLNVLKDESEVIGDVRGLGLMIGIEFVTDKTSKSPNSEAAAHFTKTCREEGMVVVGGGVNGNVVRLLPPINISEADVLKGIEIIEKIVRNMK